VVAQAIQPGDTETINRERANLRRIVACVNACQSIPTAALEANVVGALLTACEDALATFASAVEPLRLPNHRAISTPLVIGTRARLEQAARAARGQP